MIKRKKAYKQPSQLHALWVMFLVYAVPPYAWHNMWVHRKYHAWFPYVTWINVAWVSIPSIIYLLITHPQLIASGKTPLLPYQFMIYVISYAFMQIFYGLFLKKEIFDFKKLPERLMFPTILIFSADFILTLIIVPMAIPFMNNPFYDLLIWILNKQ